jgi:hypothetical protein
MSYVKAYYQMYTDHAILFSSDEIKLHHILMYCYISGNTVMLYLLCTLNVNMFKASLDNYISVQMLVFPNSLFVFSKQN